MTTFVVTHIQILPLIPLRHELLELFRQPILVQNALKREMKFVVEVLLVLANLIVLQPHKGRNFVEIPMDLP